MSTDLTLAIVTKQRPQKLKRCLLSVLTQAVLPDEVLVIDNDLQKSAYATYEAFKDQLNIKYFLAKKGGVPSARNMALSKCKTKLLGFIDDDCLLDKKWVQIAVSKLKKAGKKTTFVVGETKLYNPRKVVAIAQHARDHYWFKRTLEKGRVATRFHFDTKNVVMRKDVIKSRGLRFDPKCTDGPFDSADFDFGLCLSNHNLSGLYLNKMILFHEETTNLTRFLKRAYSRGKNAAYICRKWGLGDVLVNKNAKNFKWFMADMIRNFADEKRKYTKNLPLRNLRKVIITFLIRLHDRAYLEGYISYLV